MGWWARLRDWWRPARLARVEVVLFTRQGCHLCEEARVPLEAARKRHGFALTVRDVDSDPGWVDEYGQCVPVVTVQGKVRFRGRVNAVLLERLLQGMAGGRHHPPAG